ncbi:MAG: TRAP transporter substrate-binding protein DctP [Deferrisomatales bacterium]
MRHPESRKDSLRFLVGAVLVAVAALLPGVAPAEPVVFKLSHSWVQGDLRDNWARDFASRVETRTNGAVKFEIHPGAVLYKAPAQFDAIRQGALDVCIWPLGWSAGKYPQLSLPELPGLIDNPEEGAKFAASEAGRRMEKVAEDAGIKVLAWGWMPTSIGAKAKSVLVPADAKGLKLRGAVKPVEMMLQHAGAAITQMPSTEVYMALQTGTLDGLVTTNGSFLSFRLQELAKHLTLGKKYALMNGVFCIVIGPKSLAKLSPEHQEIVLKAAQESAVPFQEAVTAETDRTASAFKEAGATVVEMNKEQYDQWIAVAKASSWKWFEESVPGGAELLGLAVKALK